jgi:hypothetical protein
VIPPCGHGNEILIERPPTAHLCQRSIHLEVAEGAAALKGRDQEASDEVAGSYHAPVLIQSSNVRQSA